MRTADLLAETFAALSSNKVRSGLTILGVVVGIASVILMVAIGQGSKASITSSIESSGSNLLMIQPGGTQSAGGVRGEMGSADSLTIEDGESLLSGLPEYVKAVAPQVSAMDQIVVKENNARTQILGVTPEYAGVKSVEMTAGVFITQRDQDSYAKVCVLGPTTAEDLFGEGVDAVGRKVRIGTMSFKVVGVTASKGGTGFFNADNALYAPISTVQRFLLGSDSVSLINVQVVSADKMDAAKQAVTQSLLARHGISDETLADFSIMSQADILATMSTVTNTFTALLAAIASISLFVGGIGIMNMMLTTVTERTREIGLRRAIGATKGAITSQFLAESVALTVIGGGVGVAVGWGAARLVTRFAGLSTQISPVSVLVAVGVCAAIGIVFGYYPALRASRLDPIEALRYQ